LFVQASGRKMVILRFVAAPIRRIVLLSILAVFACAAPALADIMTWNLNRVTLAEDRGTVTGSFVYDSLNNLIIYWDITVTLSPATYGALPPSPAPLVVANPFTFAPATPSIPR